MTEHDQHEQAYDGVQALWILLHSRQEYWSGFPFPSPVDHVLSELSTTCLYRVALHGMADSFIELDKGVVHVIRWLVYCDCGFQSVCSLMEKDRRLMEAS